MKFETARFGAIEVKEDEILYFPEGLYGFEQERKFVLMPFDPNIESPMQWLQSLQTPGLTFVVTDPYLFIPDYQLTLTSEEKKLLQIDEESNISSRVIVNIPKVHAEMTANMVAPLVFNVGKKLAKQIVLTNIEYDTRRRLLPDLDSSQKQAAN